MLRNAPFWQGKNDFIKKRFQMGDRSLSSHNPQLKVVLRCFLDYGQSV
jgi:hypothetical protein